MFSCSERVPTVPPLSPGEPLSAVALIAILRKQAGQLLRNFRMLVQDVVRLLRILEQIVELPRIGFSAKLRRCNNIWGVIVPPTMQAYAANNYMVDQFQQQFHSNIGVAQFFRAPR